MLTFVRGNMFEGQYDILVNPVNCVGVMGKGLALVFKNRYPAMFSAYKEACDGGWFKPGKLFVWRNLFEEIICFPTKRHWREPSRYEDIEKGLTALQIHLDHIPKPEKVAVPALGCGNGGLDWPKVSEMILQHLQDLNHDIHVYEPW